MFERLDDWLLARTGNPLLVWTAPWHRRGIFPKLFLVCQAIIYPLFASVAFIAFLIVEIADGHHMGANMFVEPMMILTFFAVFLAGSFLMPWNMIVFRFPFETPAVIQELILTSITRKHLEQASTFWGVVCGSIVPLWSIAGQMVMTALAMIFETTRSYRDYEIFWAFLLMISLSGGFYLCMWKFLNFLWLRTSAGLRPMWGVLFCPLCIAHGLANLFVIAYPVGALDRFSRNEVFVISGFIVIYVSLTAATFLLWRFLAKRARRRAITRLLNETGEF
ncbi:MAG: hypothetical protein RLY93_09895 [Sumerlaeia bacterium]